MKIAILPGDGIGTEIVAEAVKVLNVLDLKFETESALVGGAAYEAFGHPLPDATLKLAKEADAVLFGAVGDWKYDKLDRPLRPEQAILGLRKNLGLFANFRPAICYPQLVDASSLKRELVSGLDILIIRELLRLTGTFRAAKKLLTPCVIHDLRLSGLRMWRFRLHESAKLQAAKDASPASTKPTFWRPFSSGKMWSLRSVCNIPTWHLTICM